MPRGRKSNRRGSPDVSSPKITLLGELLYQLISSKTIYLAKQRHFKAGLRIMNWKPDGSASF